MKYLLFLLLTGCANYTPALINISWWHDDGFTTRDYKMYLWSDNSGQDSDASFFGEGETQPNGSSILNVTSWNQAIPAVPQYNYDYTRIIAMIIDEPYWNASNQTSSPCNNQLIQQAEINLANSIQILKSYNPNILIWVNFSKPEMDWQISYNCGLNFIIPGIDILSMDQYETSIPIQYYDWLLNNRFPGQRIAMIQGLFSTEDFDAYIAANDMWGYYSYADAHPGDIYAIMGYDRLNESIVSPIQEVWRHELAKPF